jgi:hypothetical protein
MIAMLTPLAPLAVTASALMILNPFENNSDADPVNSKILKLAANAAMGLLTRLTPVG